MTIWTVTGRGQVTLRKEVLPDATGLFKAAPLDGTIDSFVGLLAGRTTKVATLEEINDTVAQAWAVGRC
jgi:hypothetical protein